MPPRRILSPASVTSIGLSIAVVLIGFAVAVQPTNRIVTSPAPYRLQSFGYVNSLTATESGYCYSSTGTTNVSKHPFTNLTTIHTNLSKVGAGNSPNCSTAPPRAGYVLQTLGAQSRLLSMVFVSVNNTTTTSNLSNHFYQFVMAFVPIYSTGIFGSVDQIYLKQFTPGAPGSPPPMKFADCGATCGGGGGSGTTYDSGTGSGSCGLSASESFGALGAAVSENECLTKLIVSILKSAANTVPFNITLLLLVALIASLASGPIGALITALVMIVVMYGWWFVQQIDAQGGNQGVFEAQCWGYTQLLGFCPSPSATGYWMYFNPVWPGY